MGDIKLPPLEYCKLDKASLILGCGVDELLHWAEIGAIELCLRFNGFKAAVSTEELLITLRQERGEKGRKWLEKQAEGKRLGIFDPFLIDNTMLSPIQPCCSIIHEDQDGKGNIRSITQYEYDGDFFCDPLCFIYGLWALSPYPGDRLFQTLQEERQWLSTRINIHFTPADYIGKESIFAHPPIDPAYKDFGLIQPQEILFTITPQDLWITRTQIEKIKNSEGKQLPSYLTGEIKIKNDLRPEINKDIRPHGNIEVNAAKRESILLAAIYIKHNFPDECCNRRGVDTFTNWAEAIGNHSHLFWQDEAPVPSLKVIKDVISDALRLPAKRRRAIK